MLKVKEYILPPFVNYNCRSLAPKANSLATDMENRNYKFGFLNEVWEDDSKKTHRNMIIKLLEENSIRYISTPRRGNKRGGGAALVWKSEEICIRIDEVAKVKQKFDQTSLEEIRDKMYNKTENLWLAPCRNIISIKFVQRNCFN